MRFCSRSRKDRDHEGASETNLMHSIRPHPANEVCVTGTFDNWSRSIRLEKGADGAFSKEVDLPDTHDKLQYKVRLFIRLVKNCFCYFPYECCLSIRAKRGLSYDALAPG